MTPEQRAQLQRMVEADRVEERARLERRAGRYLKREKGTDWDWEKPLPPLDEEKSEGVLAWLILLVLMAGVSAAVFGLMRFFL